MARRDVSKNKLSKSILEMKVCVNVIDEKKLRSEHVFPARQARWDAKPFFPTHHESIRGGSEIWLL